MISNTPKAAQGDDSHVVPNFSRAVHGIFGVVIFGEFANDFPIKLAAVNEVEYRYAVRLPVLERT
jgi:hypothetical protein